MTSNVNRPTLWQTRSHLSVRIVRLFLLGVFALTTAWALFGGEFRDEEGFLVASFIAPLSFSVASLTLALAVDSDLRTSAAWLAVALMGNSAALQLVRAGRQVRYQHYIEWIQIVANADLWVIGILILQVLLVVLGLWARRRSLGHWARRHFKAWQLGVLALSFCLTSATVSRQVSIYASELLLASFLQLANLGNVVLLVASLPEQALVRCRHITERVLGGHDGAPRRTKRAVDRFSLAIAIWVLVASGLLAIFSYERHPHLADEVAYLQHARFLASGNLTMPAPPVPKAFDLYLMQFSGDRWYPAPPPGWPMVLAIGVLAGAPWLINPVLAAVNILLAYGLLGALYSRRTARIATLLLGLSPWNLFLAMSYMTHTLTLTCALMAALGVVKARDTNRAIYAVTAGLALGMSVLVRPLEGVLVGALAGAWSLGIGGRRLKPLSIGGLVVGALLLGGLTLPYNRALTGKATTFPINQYTDEVFGPNANSFGFGDDRGMGWAIDPNPGHSPTDGLINANLNAFSLNIELFGWSIGSLGLAVLTVISGSLRKTDRHMLVVIASIFILYFFYYFSGGPDFGARYWYLMIVPLVVLSARGVHILESKLESDVQERSLGSARTWAGVAVFMALALVNFVPWRAIDKYHHYLNMRPDVLELASVREFANALVFVRGESFPDYASAAAYNPIDVYDDNGPIYVWDRDSTVRAEVIQAYPNKTIWFMDGPSVTQRGYEMPAGPLSHHEISNE